MHLLWEVKCLCYVDWTNIHSSMVSSAEAEWFRKRQATWRLTTRQKDGKEWDTVLGVLGLPVMCSRWYYLLCKLPFALRFAGHTTRIVAHNKWYHQNKTIQIYIIYNIKYIKYTNRLWFQFSGMPSGPNFQGHKLDTAQSSSNLEGNPDLFQN